MSQLRSCYFCGAVGDSLREYDLAPDELAAPGGSHSAVLCSACHEKLRRVLEPLIDDRGSPGAPERDPSSVQAVTFGSDEATPTADDRETDPDDADGTVTEDDAVEGGDDPIGEADVVETDDPIETDDASATDGTDDATATSAPESGEEDVPERYYKVLRLLQNREFPMERTELTTLVTAAYDVTEPECERVLETAIERGVLVEDGSTLDLGRN